MSEPQYDNEAERLRAENIARNNAFLESVGIVDAVAERGDLARVLLTFCSLSAQFSSISSHSLLAFAHSLLTLCSLLLAFPQSGPRSC